MLNLQAKNEARRTLDPDAAIRLAILERRCLQFLYEGRLRIVEPYVYGTKAGKVQILTQQIAGESKSGNKLPNWRRFDVAKISSIEVLEQIFRPPRDAYALQDTGFDSVLAAVA